MSCHTTRPLGSLFYHFYKSVLPRIGQQSKTAGLRLSCVIRIQFSRSSILRQPLIPSNTESNGYTTSKIQLTTRLLNKHTVLLKLYNSLG